MRFRDQPLARKALTLGVLPMVCALVTVGTAFALVAFLSARDNLRRNSEALVAVIAENVSAAVSFNDAKTAMELIRGFRGHEGVGAVCVYDSAGGLLASYTSAGRVCDARDFAPPAVAEDAWTFTQAVTVGNRRVGSVQMLASAQSLQTEMRRLALAAAASLLIAALVASALAVRIQRSISRPLLALVDTADRVAHTRQFGLRAVKTTSDEVGRLVDAFNGMLDQIQRQDRMKDEFLATLSHELRTPLNATLGWLQILQKTSPDAGRLQRALSSIEINARAQQRVVEDLLDVSRIVTGKLQMNVEVVDLRPMLSASIDVIAASAARKSIDLRVTAPAVPCLVSGDSGRLQQALWNLLSNSVKFTPAGGSIDVSLAEHGTSYELRVRDTGIGIDPAFLPRVFERFQQADGSTTREYGGLGLGLSIVNEIAILHGGRVTATSAGVGTGATFTLTLPQLVGAAELTVQQAPPRVHSAASP